MKTKNKKNLEELVEDVKRVARANVKKNKPGSEEFNLVVAYLVAIDKDIAELERVVKIEDLLIGNNDTIYDIQSDIHEADPLINLYPSLLGKSVNEWERDFLITIHPLKTLTNKQVEHTNILIKKYGITEISWNN